LKSNSGHRLLPESIEETGKPWICDEGIGQEILLFQSFHEGFDNIYKLNLTTGDFRKVTALTKKAEHLSYCNTADGKKAYALFEEEQNFKLRAHELDGTHKEFQLPYGGQILNTLNDFWILQSSGDHTRKIVQYSEKDFNPLRTIELSDVPAKELEHTVSEKISYPSFDGLKIPGIWLAPKKPLKAAIIVSFYGGDRQYNKLFQMFAELGIGVLSPAVRGSWGWGRDWEYKLKGDLGGAEILDVLWGARFLEKSLGLPSQKIGLYGSSHGGYATLRALTLPENFRGVDSRYPFGFAIAEAGFADLEVFFKDSRIADWLVNLLGPFEAELYRERSPSTYFENLQTPLLVINGTHDSRVPFSTISGFIDQLKQSDKKHRLMIHEGQGHHAGTRETMIADHFAMLEFLRDFALC
ncbi:MAG: alpha/beta hydrolase family protein, partial [Pseudobdellovibrionaceae bacterium]